jgi:ectoine hydroxylase-related dioxygenase (phytanoyl-CoA dioxygenase family)
MVCLDGMTLINGPTAFEVGSHKISDARARRSASRKYLYSRRNVRLALCPPGSVVLIHPKVRHGGGPNRSAQARRNIIVQWGMRGNALVTTGREASTGLSPEVIRRKKN